MVLVPDADAIVFIHIKCMGGLPLIALKWRVTTSSLRGEVAEYQPTLHEYLDDYPQDLQSFKGGENESDS